MDNEYNNVDNSTLITMLDELQIGGKISKYLWSFLQGRHLKIVLDNVTITRSTCWGLAQGDLLSPLLFKIVKMNICKHLEKYIFISQYADYFVFYCYYDNINEAKSKIQTALRNIYRLLLQIELEISPHKSKICLFKRGNKGEHLVVKINEHSLQVVDNVRYLG